ncbi:MAG: heavy metal translocating P-type ATPase [Myxococcota bacterium]
MNCCNSTTEGCATTGVSDGATRDEGDDTSFWLRLGAAALFVGNSMVVGLAINVSEMAADTRVAVELALLAVTVIVALLVARPLIRNFWKSLKGFDITFEFLFVTGILGALGVSIASMIRGHGPIYFEVASLLMVIYALGDRIGAVSKARSLEAAQSWLETDPTCRLEHPGGRTVAIPLSGVSRGDTVLVFAGEEIPVDGIVRDGHAFVRTAQVTGESRPLVVREGDRVLAGSHVVDASLRLEVTASAGARTIDSIAERVRRAWDRPSTWQKTADRLVEYFFPVVAIITLATFVGWTVVDGWETGLMNALAVLLVACPCAMGFAVPLAIWMTLGRLARKGLVGRSGDAIERLAEIDTVVFDKTGTLTAGSEHLVDVVVADDFERARVLEIAAAVEATSNHPVARAFQQSSLIPEPEHYRVVQSRYIAGSGIQASVQEHETGNMLEVFIGQMAPDRLSHLTEDLHAGGSARTLGLCIEGTPAAVALLDEKTLDGVDTLEAQLEELGIEAFMLTGDTEERAQSVGISRHCANMDPNEKAEFVEALEHRGHRVCFVGDGINDAAAMASSHISIAHARGSELAVDVADMTWHGDRPSIVPEALISARESVELIRHNLYYAAGYNLIGIAAAAGGVLHPVAAALIMVVSSLFVTWRTVWALDPTATDADDDVAPEAPSGPGVDAPLASPPRRTPAAS